MKYLTFIRCSESYRASPPPAALMEAMGAFVERSLKDGSLVDTGGLLPSKEGLRVRLANGQISVTDGPFTESKELVAGFAIMKLSSREEAIEEARRFLALAGDGVSEIRLLHEESDFAPPSAPGR